LSKLAKPLSVLAVVALVAVGLTAANIMPVPRFARVLYWSGVFQITRPQADAARLAALHQATKIPEKSPDGTVYTYNYTKRHRTIIESDSARCIACHGPMVEWGVATENAEKRVHQGMLTSPMMTFACTECHKQVNTTERRPSHATIRVDRDLCAKCHNPSTVAVPGEQSDGASWGPAGAPTMPDVMSDHGNDEKAGRQWILDHPKVGMSIGLQHCRNCHLPGSELDFCNDCHVRGGVMPASHQTVYDVAVNQLYPRSERDNVVGTKWKGFHFVVAREALGKLGVEVESPRQLPLDQVQKLPCGACHDIQDWCTRCHIKHNPNWLDPNEGHPAYVAKYGNDYCFRCHDTSGSQCVKCHEYVGQVN
jgi:hypothetical protein